MIKISNSKRKKLGIREFNPVNYLNDESDIKGFLDAVREEEDIPLMKDAEKLVHHARCLIDLSKKTGVSLDELRSKRFSVKTLEKFLEILSSGSIEPARKKDRISA